MDTYPIYYTGELYRSSWRGVNMTTALCGRGIPRMIGGDEFTASVTVDSRYWYYVADQPLYGLCWEYGPSWHLPNYNWLQTDSLLIAHSIGLSSSYQRRVARLRNTGLADDSTTM